ncbi:MAG: peroxiredoxin family protein [Mariniblastus sp.]|nr:peroxiredoxin family protein [Mariniblastus sp.]
MIKVTIRALIQNLIFFSYHFEGKIQMVFCRLFNRQISPLFSWLIALAIFVLSPSVGLTFQGENQGKSKALEAKASEKPTVDEDVEESLKEVLEGHSTHGEAFNEGPRQSAYLMGGTGNIHFPVTTDSKQAQAFIEQGIGQLHGFWYLEAERSFRQAAALDEDCAMAYWGAAMAAYSKRSRSQGFIKEAVSRIESVSEREKLYIKSLENYFSDKEKDKKKRAQNYLKDLESIVIKYPDDLEAKAFVAHRIWHNAREGTPISSYVSLSSLIEDILVVEPLHPAHHYMIHLWDYRHPENAVQAAARCGVSGPSIAHMWHMPGHIYSRLKRYEDAVYQQEASARVDHAHMIRDRVMPDEINNFAHNNEWLIRNLSFVGRARDAMDLAVNMTQLPRHPKHNTLSKSGGSASYGRRRLLQTLREFQLYEEAIEFCQTSVLAVSSNPSEQLKTLRLLGCSAAMVGRSDLLATAKQTIVEYVETAEAEKVDLEKQIKKLNASLDRGADAPPRPKDKKFDEKKAKLHLKQAKDKSSKIKQKIDRLNKSQLAIEGYELVAKEDYAEGLKKLESATGEDVSWLGELQFLSGESEKGLEKIAEQVKRRPSEVIPLARLVYLQFQNGDNKLAKETLEKLRDTSGSMDLDIPLFNRLAPVAMELGIGKRWQKDLGPAADIGFRPPLESLGPFRWSPSPAPQWNLTDSQNQSVGSSDFAGQPYIAIFYLGHGCLHCAEQLQAFGPRVSDFEKSGIELIAISSDDQDGLLKSIEDAGTGSPIRLASDSNHEIFRKFRSFDDFENQPLHGTFLVDGMGKIRWQDISYEPFMDHQFLLDEAERLLGGDTVVPEQAGKGSTEKQVSRR